MARSTSLEDTASINQRFLGNICLSSERWANIEEKNRIPIKIKSIYQNNIFSMQNWYWMYISIIESCLSKKVNNGHKKCKSKHWTIIWLISISSKNFRHDLEIQQIFSL